MKKNCRKHFSFEDDDKEWKEFTSCWAHCLNAVTSQQFSDRWADMKAKYRVSYPGPIKYLQKNWCPKKWLLKIAAFGTNRTTHYFNTTTSRAEGAHSILKRALRVSTGDLKTVVEKLKLIIGRQMAIRETRVAEGKYGYGRFCESNQLFAEVVGVVSPWALKKVAQQLPLITPDMPPCTRVFRKISGLPCKHVLNRRIINDEPLHADDFYKKWWFIDTRMLNGRVPKRAICRIKNPDVVKNKKRSRRANAPKSSTLRGTTAAEDEDARLNQVQRDRRRPEQQRQRQRRSITPGSTIVVATASAEGSRAAKTGVGFPALTIRPKRGRPPKTTAAPRAGTSSANRAVAAARSDMETAARTESEDLSEVGRGKRVKMATQKRKEREKQLLQLQARREKRLQARK